MQNQGLAGTTALVTGASRGIGRAIARRLAEAGARIAIHYGHNLKAAEETLAGLSGSGHILFQAEMSSPIDLQQMMEQVIQQMGGIQILVNNAGIYGYHSITDLTYDNWQAEWKRTIEVNLTGPANLMYLAVNWMKSNGGGKIINITSRGAFRGEPEAPAYGASKNGLNALGQSMAQKLAPSGIMVYTIAPGFVETDMAADILDSPAGEAIRKQSPLNRAANPDEIAGAVLYLAEGNTDYLTGCIIDVNGASYLR